MSPSAPARDSRPQTRLLLRKARSHRIVVDHVGLDPTFADMIVGFHAQQAIEKLIKAVLSHCQIAYPYVNNFDRLLHLLEAAEITQPPGAQQLKDLTPLGNPPPLRRPTPADQPRPPRDHHAGRRRRRLGISPDPNNAAVGLSTKQPAQGSKTFGVAHSAPERIRTSDLRFRRPGLRGV
jgi:hypothetical protein